MIMYVVNRIIWGEFVEEINLTIIEKLQDKKREKLAKNVTYKQIGIDDVTHVQISISLYIK